MSGEKPAVPFCFYWDAFVASFPPVAPTSEPRADCGGDLENENGAAPRKTLARIERLEEEVVYSPGLTPTCEEWCICVKVCLPPQSLEMFLLELKRRGAAMLEFFRVYLDSGSENFWTVLYCLDCKRSMREVIGNAA